MRNLNIDGTHFQLPERWSDLTPEQFLKVAAYATRELSLAEFRVLMLLSVTGLRIARKHHVLIEGEEYFYLQHGITKEFLLSAGQLLAITKTFDFMFRKEPGENGEPVYILELSSAKNLLPEIPSPYGMLYGPADGLSNISLSEYIKAESYFAEWHKTKHPQFGWQIVATLWRPGKPGYNADTDESGDRREEFNSFLVGKRAQQLAGLNRKYLSAVLMFYESCQRFIRNQWPEVYEGEQSNEKLDTFTGFMRLVNSLSDNDVTKADAVRRSMLYDVMYTLQSMAIQYRKLKEKMKK